MDSELHASALTREEREAIAGRRWFAALSPMLRHDLLRRVRLSHCPDGDLIATLGALNGDASASRQVAIEDAGHLAPMGSRRPSQGLSRGFVE